MEYPALDVDGVDEGLLLALVDDFEPTAVESRDATVTIYFSNPGRRDRAGHAVKSAHPAARVAARDVDDEDWARRSQRNLAPVTVGRITVAPPWASERPSRTPEHEADDVTIAIAPSMGFGTGHHATTRLCLRALQTLDLRGRRGLDVGTGSGVLAIAARAMGASGVVGIDDDPDAIRAARENIAANPGIDEVRFDVQDLRVGMLPTADVVTANLTGALLVRAAGLLLDALTPAGALVVSGFQLAERGEVVGAFTRARVIWEGTEEEWGAIVFAP